MTEKNKSLVLKSVKLPEAQVKHLKIESAKTGRSMIELLSEAFTKTFRVDQLGRKEKAK